MPLMANVVYQFTCLRDANSTYIGKTIQHLATRVNLRNMPLHPLQSKNICHHAQPVKTTTRVIVLT